MSPPSTENAIADKGEEQEGLKESVVEAASGGQAFEWKSNWYAVIPEQDLDRVVPHPFQVDMLENPPRTSLSFVQHVVFTILVGEWG